jgi:hypothetical protein
VHKLKNTNEEEETNAARNLIRMHDWIDKLTKRKMSP